MTGEREALVLLRQAAETLAEQNGPVTARAYSQVLIGICSAVLALNEPVSGDMIDAAMTMITTVRDHITA